MYTYVLWVNCIMSNDFFPNCISFINVTFYIDSPSSNTVKAVGPDLSRIPGFCNGTSFESGTVLFLSKCLLHFSLSLPIFV